MADSVYIAGPITGMPELNKPAFMIAEKALKDAGYIVLNPACLPEGLPPEKYMPICLSMVEAADCVYMLKGWKTSRGASIEHNFATYQGKKIYFEEEEK